jgi:ribosome-associated protein
MIQYFVLFYVLEFDILMTTHHHHTEEYSPEKIVAIAVEALEDVKGKDIIVLPTEGLTSLFHSAIICSGDSNRQVKALGRRVYEALKENGIRVLGMEGQEVGEWVLVDAGDVVVHVMQPAVRVHYDLESLWKGVAQSRSK